MRSIKWLNMQGVSAYAADEEYNHELDSPNASNQIGVRFIGPFVFLSCCRIVETVSSVLSLLIETVYGSDNNCREVSKAEPPIQASPRDSGPEEFCAQRDEKECETNQEEDDSIEDEDYGPVDAFVSFGGFLQA